MVGQLPAFRFAILPHGWWENHHYQDLGVAFAVLIRAGALASRAAVFKAGTPSGIRGPGADTSECKHRR